MDDDGLCPSDYEDGAGPPEPPEPPPPPPPPAARPQQATLDGWAAKVGNLRIPPAAPVPEGGWLVVDCFASIGGVSMGARTLGHTVVLAIDNDEDQLAVHALNHPETRHECMTLGPETEARVLELIDACVPASERHRLWLHLSPPCQSQSRMRSLANASKSEGKRVFGYRKAKRPRASLDELVDRERYDEENRGVKDAGLSLVAWSLALVAKLNPPQFSIEEVPDRANEVEELMRAASRQHPGLIDYTIVEMTRYGVPHHRERIIAARPGTVQRLRAALSLREEPPTIRQVLRLEREIKYMFGTVTRPIVPKGEPGHKVKQRANTKGFDAAITYTDGLVHIYGLDRVSPTVCCRAFPLADENYKVVRYTTPEENRALTTFPAGFQWPRRASKDQQCKGYGNAIPPLFAQKIFRAASVLV